MPEDLNVAVLQRIFDTLPEQIGDFLARGFAWETDLFPGKTQDAEAFNAFLDDLREGFRYKTILTRALGQDDKVLFEFEFDGVHSGRYPNLGDPVGDARRPVRLKAAASATFDPDGKILALATYWNCAWALAQLGVRSHMRADHAPSR